VKLLLNHTVAAACMTNWFLTMGAFSRFIVSILFTGRPSEYGE
jgi:hypothetical protein